MSLYSTFVVPDGVKPLNLSEQTNLAECIPKLCKQAQEAVYLLIAEHARICEGYNFEPLEENEPYDGEFDVKKFDPVLQYILARFVQQQSRE